MNRHFFHKLWAYPLWAAVLSCGLASSVTAAIFRYVRLVDIPGSGDFLDSQGNPILDAWRTGGGSGGFDFRLGPGVGVGVIHATAVPEPGMLAFLALGTVGLGIAGRRMARRDIGRRGIGLPGIGLPGIGLPGNGLPGNGLPGIGRRGRRS